MIRSHVAPVVALALLLVGCASHQYNPEPGRPVAKLKLRNAEGPGEIVMNAFRNAACQDAGKYVVDSTLKPGGAATLTVEAEREFAFRIQTQRPVTAANANVVATGDVTIRLNVCDAAGTFVPKAGREYEAVFTDAKGACSVVVMEAATSKPVETFVAKRWFASSGFEGWHCK